jgi:hypothetical protein
VALRRWPRQTLTFGRINFHALSIGQRESRAGPKKVPVIALMVAGRYT